MDKHRTKFKQFKRLCTENQGTTIIVANLRALGDTPEEIGINVEYACNQCMCKIDVADGIKISFNS